MAPIESHACCANRFFLLRILVCLLSLLSACRGETVVDIVASLTNPDKLATLDERGANSRVQKIVYWLHIARIRDEKPEAVVDAALKHFGWKGTLKGELTKAALLRNLDIAGKLGCLDGAGLSDMRRGQSPTIRKGPYAGDELSVDHIIPRAILPELDNVLANLELLPLKLNLRKGAKVGDRQRDTARKFAVAGLLTLEQAERVR